MTAQTARTEELKDHPRATRPHLAPIKATREELYAKARQLGTQGSSKMNKSQLQRAVAQELEVSHA
jgi:hypothetical protein